MHIMSWFKIVYALAVITLTGASSLPRESSSTDADLGLALIECARKAILTGIPEIGVPSHNPLLISKNVSQDIELGDIRGTLALNNMRMEDIPSWQVTQFDLVDSNDEGADVFNYTIYWRDIILKSQWQLSAHLGNLNLTEKEGDMSLEYDHVNFEGVLNFTKPGPGRNATINDLSLDITTLNAQLNITNLGVLGDLVNQAGGPALALLLNHNPAKDLLGEALKFKLNRDWIYNLERLDILIQKCKE